MPILDDILAQPAILISMGVALLLIVAAIVLAVLPRIKASRARTAKRRKAARVAAQNAAVAEAELDADAEDAAIEKPVAARKSGAAQSAKAAAPSAPVVAAKAPVPAAPSAPVVSAGSPAAAAASALSGGTTEAKKEEVTPEMQDLLSSVFSDEDNSERQAILLKGMESVAIDELLTLSKAVAAQLRGEQPSNIVRVKENQLT